MVKKAEATSCPTEKIVRDALLRTKLEFTEEENPANKGLDFRLTKSGACIEVCQFYTPRKIEQLNRVKDCILIQGLGAAIVFSTLIDGA